MLVVEDDPTTRALIVRALATEFGAYAAESAEAALSLIPRIPTPEAIVTDVMMPGMDGFQLARLIKAIPACSKVPIMFLTARGDPSDVVKGINAGARHYLTKPFKVESLLEKVRKMVSR